MFIGYGDTVSKKTYVLDTNVLLSDPNCLHAFEENDIIIPMAVLEELDKQKSRQDDTGRNARIISRMLDDLRDGSGILKTGVSLGENFGKLNVATMQSDYMKSLPPEMVASKVDNVIIAFMLQLKNNKQEAILISKDINVRLKCDSLGVKCEDYRKMKVASDRTMLYTGVQVVDISNEMINEFYQNRSLPIKGITETAHPNEMFVLKCEGSQSALAKCVNQSLVPILDIKKVHGLTPKNKEQKFALDLLFDPNIKMVSLIGIPGSGKTILALAAGLDQLNSIASNGMSRYERIIVTKPVLPVGHDIGFLPGSLEEKMEPWVAPIKDNLNFLMSNSEHDARKKKFGLKSERNEYMSMMLDKGLIEIEAITFIRGRSIPNSYIIIDEAQNISLHELKTIITRVGEGTKIVLTGDIDQIDNVHLDAYTNGLTYAAEKFKNVSIAGHISLIKGERSELATLAANIL